MVAWIDEIVKSYLCVEKGTNICPQVRAHYQQKVCRKDGGFRMTNTQSLGAIEATNPVLTVAPPRKRRDRSHADP